MIITEAIENDTFVLLPVSDRFHQFLSPGVATLLLLVVILVGPSVSKRAYVWVNQWQDFTIANLFNAVSSSAIKTIQTKMPLDTQFHYKRYKNSKMFISFSTSRKRNKESKTFMVKTLSVIRKFNKKVIKTTKLMTNGNSATTPEDNNWRIRSDRTNFRTLNYTTFIPFSKGH